jgi:hypothetical protein
MVVAQYGDLVLKMPSANGIIKIHGDRSASVFALQKLQALVMAHEVVAGQGAPKKALSSLHQHISSSAPRVQPSEGEDVPVMVIPIDTDAA